MKVKKDSDGYTIYSDNSIMTGDYFSLKHDGSVQLRCSNTVVFFDTDENATGFQKLCDAINLQNASHMYEDKESSE